MSHNPTLSNHPRPEIKWVCFVQLNIKPNAHKKESHIPIPIGIAATSHLGFRLSEERGGERDIGVDMAVLQLYFAI